MLNKVQGPIFMKLSSSVQHLCLISWKSDWYFSGNWNECNEWTTIPSGKNRKYALMLQASMLTYQNTFTQNKLLATPATDLHKPLKNQCYYLLKIQTRVEGWVSLIRDWVSKLLQWNRSASKLETYKLQLITARLQHCTDMLLHRVTAILCSLVAQTSTYRLI